MAHENVILENFEAFACLQFLEKQKYQLASSLMDKSREGEEKNIMNDGNSQASHQKQSRVRNKQSKKKLKL